MRNILIFSILLVISIGLMPSVFAQSTNSTLSIDSLNVYSSGEEMRFSINGQKPTNTELTLDYIFPNGQPSGTTTIFNNSTASSYSVDWKIWNLNAGENYIVKVCTESQQCLEETFDIMPSFPSVELFNLHVSDGWGGENLTECGYLHNGQLYQGIKPSSTAVYTCESNTEIDLNDLTTRSLDLEIGMESLFDINQPYTLETKIIASNSTTVFNNSFSGLVGGSFSEQEIRWNPTEIGTFTATVTIKSTSGELLANSETITIDLTDSSIIETVQEPTPETVQEPTPETQEETDNVSPQVLVPNDIVLQATNQSGAIASFNPQAIDNIDELLTPSCNYSSGSVFPIGTTIVTCTATDSSGNSNSNSFSVIVNYTDYSVPNWVKNVAGFWNQGDINDESFLEGISYLIQNDIIVVPSTETTTQTESTVPSWVKTNAGWWSSGEINDETFVNGIQYLIQIGLIQV